MELESPFRRSFRPSGNPLPTGITYVTQPAPTVELLMIRTMSASTRSTPITGPRRHRAVEYIQYAVEVPLMARFLDVTLGACNLDVACGRGTAATRTPIDLYPA